MAADRQPGQEQKQDLTATGLIQQGKLFYRSVRLKEAFEKFESALKLEPDNDEALGLAAVTAYRLDNQAAARDYFLRRADLAGQKDSVRAFCYYRTALAFWREIHDRVARFGEVGQGRFFYRISRQESDLILFDIDKALEYADRALGILVNYGEAFNVRNLLQAEAALIEPDSTRAEARRLQSLEALRRSLDLSSQAAGSKRAEVADFSLPTFRVSEFARTPEDDPVFDDEAIRLIEGGRPVRRQVAAFPPFRAQPRPDKGDKTEPPTPEPAPAPPQTIKVEVLISTNGDVVFAHVIDGRPDINTAALLAARGWKFSPARFEGRPVQVSGVITFEVKQQKLR